MPTSRTLLSQYRYDPLDRLLACNTANLGPQQRFYCKSRLASEIQGAIAYSFFRTDDWLLAQRRRKGEHQDTGLLATDQPGSVLKFLGEAQAEAMVYSPYGQRTPGGGLSSLLGFNGERAEPVTGHYLLGDGYRAFNPVLMRFNSPDSQSPFDKGGINAYAYCGLNPVGNIDPTGHFYWRLAAFAVGGVLTVGSVIGGLALGDKAGQALAIAGSITGLAVMGLGSIFLNPGGARTVPGASMTRRAGSIVQGGGTQPLLSSADLPPEYIQTTKLASIQRSDKLARKFGMVLSSTPPEPPPPTYEQAMQLRRGK
ncbi:RHS repeat-associated core domain-containing protein [Pseudomonas sp. RHF3.3-3]|uniref:RHS repeat-associated core domain-containing protein n=1 Tax=Pseudomonas sp. RHF3.3-3 TaxID=3396624 RepID=UPI003A86E38D